MKGYTAYCYCFLILMGFNLSCSTSYKRENSDEDIESAKTVCERFLKYEAHHMNDSIDKVMIDVESSAIEKGLFVADSALGAIVKYSYVEGTSRVVVKDKHTTGNYNLIYQVERKNKQTSRIFYLVNDNGDIKVEGFEDKFEID